MQQTVRTCQQHLEPLKNESWGPVPAPARTASIPVALGLGNGDNEDMEVRLPVWTTQGVLFVFFIHIYIGELWLKRITKNVCQIHEFPFFYVPMARKKRSVAQSKNSVCVTLCTAGKHSTQKSLLKVKSPPDHGWKPTHLEEKSWLCTHLHWKIRCIIRGAREGISAAEVGVCGGPLPRYTQVWGAGLPCWLGRGALLEWGNCIERGEGEPGDEW